MKILRRLIACASLILAHLLYAPTSRADLSADSQQALEQTKALLSDPKAIEAYAKTHPEAASANENVNTLVGGRPEDSAAVYKIANEIFEAMVKDSKGDPLAMQETLSKAMKNPQSFAEKLSPSQQAELSGLAKKIESRAPGSAPH